MTFQAVAYPPFWRAVSVCLFLVSRGALLVLLALLLFFETRLSNPLRLIRVFAEVFLLPGIAAWLLEKAYRATLVVRDGVLVVDARAHRIEIPCDSIQSADLSPFPLPSGVLWLTLKSGRHFPYALAVANPADLLEAIAHAGGSPQLGNGIAAVNARTSTVADPPWYRPILKYVVFALVPALPLFRLHQWITYGGTFGEYYLYGLEAYLLAFAIYWAQAAIWLILLDTALAGIAAAITLTAAAVLPSAVATSRRIALVARNIVYYGSVPLFLLRLLLLS